MAFRANVPLDDLTKKELEILQYIHNHGKEVAFMSIHSFAQEINYSTSTVIRFCRKLGYSGFPELKYEIRKQVEERNEEEKDAKVTFSQIKKALFMDLDGTTGLLNSDSIVQIMELLSKDIPVYIHKPGGITDLTLDYLESILFLSGCKYVVKSSASKLTKHLIRTVDQESIFFFISNSGNFPLTLSLAKEAKSYGKTVVSISSIENNDLAEVSDYNLRLFSKQRENVGADLTSRLSTYFVLSSLAECFSKYKKGNNAYE